MVVGAAAADVDWHEAVVPAAAPVAAGLQLQRDGQRLLISSFMPWQLPDEVKDALRNGIPVHFVLEADVVRQRWWWRDAQLAHAQRYLRLSYQPLTRRWRLHQSGAPLAAGSLGVGASYSDMQDALAVMQRLSSWHIGDASALSDAAEVLVSLRVRIDLSQFPRPLQIGALGRTDWNRLAEQTLRVSAEHW